MADSATDINESLRCPTCNAAQAWSDECRRCKSDLRLLRRIVQARRQHRINALLALHAGHYSEALIEARHAHELHPDGETTRLVTVCQLLAGNWQQAMLMARDSLYTLGGQK